MTYLCASEQLKVNLNTLVMKLKYLRNAIAKISY